MVSCSPADGVVLAATNLAVDESLLTGQSVSVRKLPWSLAAHESEGQYAPAPAVSAEAATATTSAPDLPHQDLPHQDLPPMGRLGGDDLPFVYSGTPVVQGTGLIEVRRTGQRTEIGQIGRALHRVPVERTRVQREVGRLVRILAIEALALCALVVLVYGIVRGHWLEGILAGYHARHVGHP
jgi:Ca2+-transporting ATPase